MWKYSITTDKGEHEILAENILKAEEQARSELKEGEKLFGISSSDYDAMIDPRDDDFRKGPY